MAAAKKENFFQLDTPLRGDTLLKKKKGEFSLLKYPAQHRTVEFRSCS